MTEDRAQRWPVWGKVAPAIAAILVNLVMIYALIVGLRTSPLLRAVDDARLALFDLEPPKARPDVPLPKKAIQANPGGGAAPLLPSRPQQNEAVVNTPLIAPAPVIAIPTLPPLSAPVGAGDGNGSAGGGGVGSGTGTGSAIGGGAGSGEGDGDGFSRAKQTGGRFRNSDFPDWLRGVGRVKIGVRYAIGPSGNVEQCEIIEKSGYAEVDAMTCRIIMERYRFRPARDPEGYAVTEVREEDYRWRVR